jgi:hypothetical protein
MISSPDDIRNLKQYERLMSDVCQLRTYRVYFALKSTVFPTFNFPMRGRCTYILSFKNVTSHEKHLYTLFPIIFY